MCGRYVITNPVSKTRKIVKTSIKVEDIENYNAHPYQNLPVIKKYTNGSALEKLKWGIVPSWSKKKDFKPLINARLETIDEKFSFKKLIINSRAVIPCSGYYEWKKTENKKVPYYFTKVDSKDIFLAGIHNQKQFCVITREAESSNSEIHHRQPVIIQKSQINNYFNLNNNAVEFLNNTFPPKLKFFEISTDVNNPAKNDPSIINPLKQNK